MMGDSLGRWQDWRDDEIADSLIRIGGIPPMVVVGIGTIGMTDRGRGYLPWEDIYLSPPTPRPEGATYPEFIVEGVLRALTASSRCRRGSRPRWSSCTGAPPRADRLESVVAAICRPGIAGGSLSNPAGRFRRTPRRKLKSTEEWRDLTLRGLGLANESVSVDGRERWQEFYPFIAERRWGRYAHAYLCRQRAL